MVKNYRPKMVMGTGFSSIMTGSYNATRMNAAIDKAFAASPYLKTN